MKKFLILIMVLGFVSTASAALTPITSWTDGVCTWTLDIANSTVLGTGTSASTYTSPWINAVTGSMAKTPMANLDSFKDAVWSYAGDLGDVTVSGGLYQASSNETGLGTNISANKWFQFDVTFAGNDFKLDYWDGAAYQTALQGTVPEPMTIALLGLGGLFLRRRK